MLVNPQITDGPLITGTAGTAPTVTSSVNGAPAQPAADVGTML